MDLSGLGSASSTRYAIGVQKIAQDQQKVEGQAQVALIADAAPTPPPPGPAGQGTRINTYG